MKLLIFILSCFLSLNSAWATEKEKTLHQPNYEVWVPPTFLSSEEKWPLILFSHGLGGCGRQSTYLTEYLADHGYIVAAPDHADARWCRDPDNEDFETTQEWTEQPLRFPKKWTDATERDRRDDLLFVLEDLLKDRKYANYIDQEKIGLMGHSLGGYTVLGMAGGWPNWKDSRFKAVAALSPYMQPYLAHETLGKIDIPVMYQGGTKDTLVTPVLKRSDGAYAMSKAPKYLIELDGGKHSEWSQRGRDFRGIINETVLAFFDKHLKGEDTIILRADRKTPRVATYWHDEGPINQKAPPSLDE